MTEGAKYRFEQIWLIILNLLVVYFAHITVSRFISHPYLDNFSALILSLFVFALWPATTIINLTFKMMKGLPALIITESGIIDNVNNISIKWNDIFEIYITGEGRFAGGNLVINLNNPYEFFGTSRLQITSYKIRRYFTSADVAIKLSFVKGKTEDIVNTINTYWAQS